MLAAFISALHVLSLGIGLGAVFARGRALRAVAAGEAQAAKQVLFADTFWGATKIALFGLIFALEIVPMTTFIRWRIALRKGGPLDMGLAALLIRLNDAETALVILIPFVAAAMARGLWLVA